MVGTTGGGGVGGAFSGVEHPATQARAARELSWQKWRKAARGGTCHPLEHDPDSTTHRKAKRS